MADRGRIPAITLQIADERSLATISPNATVTWLKIDEIVIADQRKQPQARPGELRERVFRRGDDPAPMDRMRGSEMKTIRSQAWTGSGSKTMFFLNLAT